MTPARRLVSGLLLVLATLLGVATSAWAYWTATGSGTGSATTATLNPPETVTASSAPGTSTVALTWSAPTGGIAPQGYTVTRTPQPGGTPAPACGGGTITDISCTDSPVPDGTYTYVVTAVYASWRTPSASSGIVTVSSAPVDTTKPTVTQVSSTAADGTYRAGATIPITITFSEPVQVTGMPTLSLKTGAGATSVNYTPGSGSTTLTFTYTVAAGDTSADLDYESTGSLALNGGTIRDAASNDAVLTLAAPGAAGSLGATKALVIDTTAPVVVSIVRAGASEYVKAGPLAWTVTFSEPVTGVSASNFTVTSTGITATPSITGVTPLAGPPAATWTVTASTNGATAASGSIRLDLISPGTIQDPATNPLATTSFQGEAFTYDTTAPTVASITRVGTTATNAGSLSWTVTFSEPVTGVAAGNFTVTSTGITATPSITSVTPLAGPPAATWTVTASTNSATAASGSIRLDLISPGTIQDPATNPLATTSFQGEAFTYDTTAPLVGITAFTTVGGSGKVRLSGSGEVGLPVTVTLCFSLTSTPSACTEYQTVTVPALAGTTWQLTSTIRAQGLSGTWYATTSQTDLAGNTTTVAGPPLAT